MQFKRADYLLPAFPGAALALGCFAERAYAGFHFRRRLAYSFGIALLGCVLGWWYYVDYYLPRVEPTLEHKAFASEIRKRAPAPEEVVFFRTEAHNLAWRLGRPLRILVQWPDLDTLVAAPEPAYVVMPVESAKQWQEQVRSGYLDEVIRNTDLTGGEHDKPMILFRTRSKAVTLAR